MFDEKQKRLFNQGYGAYRDIISFCIENILILHDEDDDSARAALIVMCDLQLQKLLFNVSNFPSKELTDAEKTFIKSIIESSSFLKEFINGYSKFYRNMTENNYYAISEHFEEVDELHIAVLIATKLDPEKRQDAVNSILEKLTIVLNSYLALSEGDVETENSTVMHIISKFEKYAIHQGITVVLPKKKAIAEKETFNGEEKLAELIGLETVKEDVVEMLNILKVNEMRKKEGLNPINISKHMVFTGNPGTGKTSVARIIAQIYKENGIVSKGQLVETDRSGLVDTIIGGTAQKVKNVVENAIGGLLFIDEAYALAPKDSDRDFGHEAIATLVKLMEDNKDDLVVIVAGYKKEMQHFIESNPGLKSRFKKHIEFSDYTPEQMQEIFIKMLNEDGYTLAHDAIEPLNVIWEKSKADISFGNGRGVRNVFEQVLARHATRMVRQKNVAKLELTTIEKEDIPVLNNLADSSKRKNRIGFIP